MKQRIHAVRQKVNNSKWVIASILIIGTITAATIVVALSDAAKQKADKLFAVIQSAAVSLQGEDLDLYYQIVKLGLQESIAVLKDVQSRLDADTSGTGTNICSYTYSAYGACQNNVKTRTVVSSLPAGCTGTPVLTESCSSTGTTVACTSFTYSEYGACQNNIKTRTMLSGLPAGCTGGTPVLTESCSSTSTGTENGDCTGTLPAAGAGMNTPTPYSITSSIGYTPNTVWTYIGDLASGLTASCTWSCKGNEGYTGNAARNGCSLLAEGEGMTIKVLDDTTGAPISGVTMYAKRSLIDVTTSNVGYSITDSAGKSKPFVWPYPNPGAGDLVYLNLLKDGYSIVNTSSTKNTICSHNTQNPPEYCSFPLAYNGSDHVVTVYMSSNGSSTTTALKITYSKNKDLSTSDSTFSAGNTLYGYIDGGDVNNTWACLDGPDAINNCETPDKFRQLTLPINGVADGWQINNSRTPKRIENTLGLLLTADYPSGTYTSYARTGQNGTDTVIKTFEFIGSSTTTLKVTYSKNKDLSTSDSSYGVGDTLYGYIDGGDVNNTWACLDGPDAINNCETPDKFRQLTLPVNGVADGWQINNSRTPKRLESTLGLPLTIDYPFGTYTSYIRTGQNGTDTVTKTFYFDSVSGTSGNGTPR